MKADVYQPSARPYTGLPELAYPFHDRTIQVTCCGRICPHRKKLITAPSLLGRPERSRRGYLAD
jgi:hypothetical protein